MRRTTTTGGTVVGTVTGMVFGTVVGSSTGAAAATCCAVACWTPNAATNPNIVAVDAPATIRREA